MARAPVPTVEYFRRRAVRPDAFVNIPDQDVADALAEWTDRFASYTGKHTRRVIVNWDRSFPLAIVGCAAFDLMTHRGFKKDAGADSAIKARSDEMLEWGNQVARGEVEPFVDDGAGYDDDAAIGSTAERSDAWTAYSTGPCGCGG